MRILMSLLAAVVLTTASAEDGLAVCTPACGLINTLCASLPDPVKLACVTLQSQCKSTCTRACRCINDCYDGCTEAKNDCNGTAVVCAVGELICRLTKCGTKCLNITALPPSNVLDTVTDLTGAGGECKVNVLPIDTVSIITGSVGTILKTLSLTPIVGKILEPLISAPNVNKTIASLLGNGLSIVNTIPLDLLGQNSESEAESPGDPLGNLLGNVLGGDLLGTILGGGLLGNISGKNVSTT